jgi:hypothetical protein
VNERDRDIPLTYPNKRPTMGYPVKIPRSGS